MKWATKATLEEDDVVHTEKVMICEVNEDQWVRVGEFSSIKQPFLWIERIGWLVREPGSGEG